MDRSLSLPPKRSSHKQMSSNETIPKLKLPTKLKRGNYILTQSPHPSSPTFSYERLQKIQTNRKRLEQNTNPSVPKKSPSHSLRSITSLTPVSATNQRKPNFSRRNSNPVVNAENLHLRLKRNLSEPNTLRPMDDYDIEKTKKKQNQQNRKHNRSQSVSRLYNIGSNMGRKNLSVNNDSFVTPLSIQSYMSNSPHSFQKVIWEHVGMYS